MCHASQVLAPRNRNSPTCIIITNNDIDDDGGDNKYAAAAPAGLDEMTFLFSMITLVTGITGAYRRDL